MAQTDLHLTDFSDRLSPMLVKELRQGMRTHLFTIAFILLQAFMVLSVLIGASAPGNSPAVAGFFWFFVIVALLIVMPVRGFAALSTEIQLNTMDLIQLTRLGAWRMTFGKWAALVAQTLLLVCGILPYLVMRYFFGGMDLMKELLGLFWVLVLSMVFTAITVGFSAFRSVLLRATVAVGLLILVAAGEELVDDLFRLMLDRSTAGATTSTAALGMGACLFTAVYLSWFMLDLGASRIAPEADNHAARKRLMALAFGLIMLTLPLFGLHTGTCLIIVGIIWMLVCLDALTERPTLLPSLLVPFSKRWFLRPFPLLLAPGWTSGIFFYLLCATLYAIALQLHTGFGGLTLAERQVVISAAALVVFPLIPLHLFFRRITEPGSIFGIYLLIQVCAAVVGFFLMIMADETPVGRTAYFFIPLPATTLFAATQGGEEKAMTLAAAAIGIMAIIITVVRGLPWYRDVFRMMAALRASRS